MKKWTALALALVMCLSLCACGGNQSDSAEASQNTENQLVGSWEFESGEVVSGTDYYSDKDQFHYNISSSGYNCKNIQFFNDGTCLFDDYNYTYELIYDGQAIVLKNSYGSSSNPMEFSFSSDDELTLSVKMGNETRTMIGHFVKAD